MNPSSFLRLVRVALSEAGPAAPLLLVNYARLTKLNRTSRSRQISSVPRLQTDSSSRDVGSTPPRGDLLVPVYNNFEDTRSLLSALAKDKSFDGRVIIVHDASTDERLRQILSTYASTDARAVLIENKENLGFVKSCNVGFRASRNDVVILNTDITLPPAAPGRLLRHLQSPRDIATVTPFSNNAYGVGLPHLVYPNPIPFSASPESVDAALRSLRPIEPITLATGVGFCMAISRKAIDALGGFDEIFSPGYGEETDFCQRATALGYRHVLASNVYVEHKGGQSFGGAWQDKSRRGLLKVLRRHPRYVDRVCHYLQTGETRAVAMAALTALAENLSGMTAVVRQNTAPPADVAHQPTVTISKSGSGWRARLSFAHDEFDFDFAGPDAVRSVLALTNR